MSRWWIAAAWLAAVCVAVSCNTPDSNPHDVISMSVDTPPAPSIIAGDTMRIGDSTALGTLQATAYNISGKVLNVPILWLTLDPAIVTTDTFGHVYAATDSVPSTPRIVAQAGNLQSLPFTIPVEPKPDSLATDTTDTTQHLFGFCLAQGPISSGIDADLYHTAPLGDSVPLGVDNYLVHWAITAPPKFVAKQTNTIADTGLLAYIADLSGNPANIDTTKNGGFSTRVLTFGSKMFNPSFWPMDSTATLTVQATARYQGRQIHYPVTVTITFDNPTTCPSGT
jgi:hypothetical protein